MLEANKNRLTAEELAELFGNLSVEKRELLELLMQEEGLDIAELGITPQKRNYFPDQKTAWMPVSNSQQRLWFLDQFDPDSPSYNIPTPVRLSGKVNPSVLKQALNAVISRHEVLRTTFSTRDGQPVQVIHAELEIDIPFIDLSILTKGDQDEQIKQLIHADAVKSFSLKDGPLIRAVLIIISDTEHIFLLTMHHIVSDGWSIGVFIQEMMVSYDALVKGQPSKLPERSIQYADFAVWQRKWLAGEKIKSQIEYWLENLSGKIPALNLSTDKPRPAVMTGRGDSYTFIYPYQLADSLRTLAQENKATLFMVLIAGLYVLLHRYTGEQDLTIGTPVANRNRVELENLIGMLINTIVLRTQITGDMTFTELLEGVKETTLNAYANQDVPFELVIEKLQPDRDTSHTPLFQVMMILQNVPGQLKRLPGITMEALPVHSGTSTFDLTISITERADGLYASFEYNTDIFFPETIERLAGHFQVILESIVENASQAISQIRLLSEDERKTILFDWNNHFTNEPAAPFVHQLIGLQANERPNSIAIRMAGENYPVRDLRSDQFTYLNLEKHTNQLANYLRKRGVGPECLVGVCMERSLDVIISLFGILKAGGVYVPLDPSFPADRLDYMLRDSHVSLVLTHQAMLDRLPMVNQLFSPVLQSTDTLVEKVCLDTEWQAVLQEPTETPDDVDLEPDNLAYVIYTSGSTGRPKGVAITHGSIAEYTRSMARLFEMDAGDRALQFSSFNFDTALEEIFVPLMSGAELIVRDNDFWTAEQFQRVINQHQISYLSFTPSYWHLWVQYIYNYEQKFKSATRSYPSDGHLTRSEENIPFSGYHLPRIAILGGESMLASTVSLWRSTALRHTRLMNTYGPTEITITATAYEVPVDNLSYGESDNREKKLNRSVENSPARSPIGRPHPNRTAYIVDRYGNPCPVGVPGELLIGGSGLARGYLNQPDLTAEKFFPDPFAQDLCQNLGLSQRFGGENRLYRTGDLARYLPDGTIDFLGRIDSQVKIRGYRVELEEIESVIKDVLGVRDSAVVIHENASGDKQIVAFIVPAEEWFTSITDDGRESEFLETIRSELKTKLTEFMLPAHYFLLTALPLNVNGKIDRIALSADLGDRIDGKSLHHEHLAPRTPTEERLCDIWQALLHRRQIGVNDNFFELGGHSLLATQIVSRINESFQVEIPVRVLFESPTIASLAGQIEQVQDQSTGWTPAQIPLLTRDGETGLPINPPPLSYGQQRLWFLDQFEPGTPNYNIPTVIRLAGNLDIDAFQTSLSHMVQRHEILRTSIQTIDGRPIQLIHPAFEVKIEIEDYSSWSGEFGQQDILNLVTEEVRKPFDLSQLPLFRVKLFKLAEQDYLAAFTMHHIISDGWSTTVMVRELAAFYPAILEGMHEGGQSKFVIPELRLQYADYASWQRDWLVGDNLQKQMNYWREQLADLPAVIDLPFDRPRPAIQSSNGNVIAFELEDGLAIRLSELSKEMGSSLFMTLLAAFQVLLMRYSGQADICVGTPIANRNHKAFEDLIGFFVNTLVLRTDLSGELNFRQVIERVKQTALGAYAHQDVPFEMLVNELQPERDMSHSPLFQVMFVMQNLPEANLALPGIQLSSVDILTGIATFDLTLVMEEISAGSSGQKSPGTTYGLRGGFEYNTDLLEASTIQRMIEHFKTLLKELTETPDHSVSRLPMLAEVEMKQIFLEWNDTVVSLPLDLGVHTLFELQVDRTPHALALAFGDQRFTYAQLNQKANQLAHFLLQQGLKPENLVGLCIERSPEMVIGLLGILKAGGAYVPLDPGYPKDRLMYMLSDMNAAYVLTRQRYSDIFKDFGGQLVQIDEEWSQISLHDQINPQLSDFVQPNAGAENLAYVIYTSGSTGRPKGVQVSHRSVTNFISWAQKAYQIGPGERVLQFASLNFDTAVEEIFPTLISGALLVLRSEHSLTSFEEFRQLIENYQLTVLDLPTAYWHAWVAELDRTGEQIPACVRLVIVGGEQAFIESYRTWLKLSGPGIQWFNTYGPSEATVVCLFYEPDRDLGGQEPTVLPIGRPIDNAQAYVVDANLLVLPVGVPGELVIGGVGLTRGYLNLPELSAEKFVEPPIEWGDMIDRVNDLNGTITGRKAIVPNRLYRTGDRVRYLQDGTLDFLGRIDDQVKLRGMRVEPGEIETVLRQCPDILDAVVLARKDPLSGLRLVAYLIPVSQEFLNGFEGAQTNLPQDIAAVATAFLKDKLPSYMVPSAYVILQAFPLTPNGKVDRKALPAPSPDQVLSAESGGHKQYIEPRTPEESLLVDIWKQVLGVERVSVMDNFFELGGDSILSIQVTARANQAGLHINPRQIFEGQTIAELAALAGAGQVVKAEQGLVTGQQALTPIQHWFFEQALPNPNHFNQSLMLEVHQPLDPHILRLTTTALIQHHDIFRLHFRRAGNIWEAEYGSSQAVSPFEYVDLQDLTAKESQTAQDNLGILDYQKLIEAKAEQVQTSLDISNGPLLRIVYFKLSDPNPGRLLIVIHHLVIDGVSWRILIDDLMSVYRQLEARYIGGFKESLEDPVELDTLVKLPSKTTSYKSWADLLFEYANSQPVLDELAYWLGVTQGSFDSILPDHPQGDNFEASTDTISRSLDYEQTRQLLQEVPVIYKTEINDLLLAAFIQAYQTWTTGRGMWPETRGETNLLLLLEGHGREAILPGVDLSRTVGWFTSLYPARLIIKESDGPGEVIKKVKEQLHHVPAKGMGYGLLRYLRRDINEQLKSAFTPQIAFNYLGQISLTGQASPPDPSNGQAETGSSAFADQSTVDQRMINEQIFRAAKESSGASAGPATRRAHLIEVGGGVVDGILSLSWSYGKDQFNASSIEQFADVYMGALKTLIQHCLSPEAGGYTSSDFPLAGIGQSTLDKVLSKVTQSKRGTKG